MEEDNTPPSIKNLEGEPLKENVPVRSFYSDSKVASNKFLQSAADKADRAIATVKPVSRLGADTTRSPSGSTTYSDLSKSKRKLFNDGKVDKSLPLFVGFPNMGNTCFMNAILQCLYGLNCFSQDLLFCYLQLQNTRLFRDAPLTCNMAKLLQVKLQGPMKDELVELLTQVKRSVKKNDGQERFPGHHQYDGQEFLLHVLDQMSSEVLKAAKHSGVSEENLSDKFQANVFKIPLLNPPPFNFRMGTKGTLECCQCSNVVIQNEHSMGVSAPCPKKGRSYDTSLQFAVLDHFQPQVLDYVCEKCQHDRSRQSWHVEYLPRILIVHLKRFEMNEVTRTCNKIYGHVQVPQFITLKPVCSQETTPPFPNTMSKEPHFKLFPDLPVPDSQYSPISAVENSPNENRENGGTEMGFVPRIQKTPPEKPDSTTSDLKEKEDADIRIALERSLHESNLSADILQGAAQTDEQEQALIEAAKAESKKMTDMVNISDEATEGAAKVTGVNGSDDLNNNNALGDTATPQAPPTPPCGDWEAIVENMKTGALEYSYELCGVVTHCGNKDFGHYFCDLHHFGTGKWYKLDDEQSSAMNMEDRKLWEANGYIFFYMYRDIVSELKEDGPIEDSPYLRKLSVARRPSTTPLAVSPIQNVTRS